MVLFRPGPLARQLDEFRPLIGRQFGQKREGRRSQFSPERAPLVPGLIEQQHHFCFVRVGFGEFGPRICNQRLDGLTHRLHPRTHGSSVFVKGRLLLRIEGELRFDLLEPLFWAHRERGALNPDPQSAGDKAKVQRQR